MNKKLFILIPTLTLVTTLFTSCQKENTLPSISNEPQLGGEVVDDVNDFELDNLSNLQAITTVNLMSYLTPSSNPSLSSITTLDRHTLTQEEKQEIKDLLPTLDLLLNEDFAYTSTIIEEINVINNTTYSFKETVSYLDNTLTNTSITFFFNVREIENPRSNNNGYFKQTILDGYALLPNDTTYYPFDSIVEEEKERDEVETERKFSIQLDQNTKILVEEENEVERNETETEFTYKILENNRVTSEYSISIELEGNKKEVSYEMNEKEYEVEKIMHNNNEVYKVEYEDESSFQEVEATLFFIKTIQNGVAIFEEYNI